MIDTYPRLVKVTRKLAADTARLIGYAGYSDKSFREVHEHLQALVGRLDRSTDDVDQTLAFGRLRAELRSIHHVLGRHRHWSKGTKKVDIVLDRALWEGVKRGEVIGCWQDCGCPESDPLIPYDVLADAACPACRTASRSTPIA